MDGEIGTEELRSLLDGIGENGKQGDGAGGDESVRVVDIRSPGAYSRGHIPGSENVPLQRLVDDIEQFEGDERVVTVCPKGKSSVQAARLITSYEGFDGRAESFAPGLSNWDGPIEKGGDSAEQGADDEGPQAPF
jgi:rhodanese-related sulfurtransferase